MAEYEQKMEQTVLPLLVWFGEHARVLPWRTDPSPYRVWVSEIMLQQTRVAAVMGYFERFMGALPTVSDLAEVPEDELMKLWQGLGYYNRARNLQKAAQVVVSRLGGEIPADYDAIRALPGIGDYTAGAVASIAFGIPVPAVDGNVLRVVARILGDDRDITRPDTKAAVRELLLRVIPQGCPGAFNQALMELGATVCLPNGAPQCRQCPVAGVCTACREERWDTLPVKAPKKGRRIEERVVYLIFWEGTIALRRRPGKGLLAGLWEYPNVLWGEQDETKNWNLAVKTQENGCKGKHIFTHIEWRMQGRILTLAQPDLPEGWVWASRRELEQKYAVPNAFQCFLPEIDGRLTRWEGLV